MAEKSYLSGFDLIQLEESSEARKQISFDELMSQLNQFERSVQKQEEPEETARTRTEHVDVQEAVLLPIYSNEEHKQEREHELQKMNTKFFRGPSAEQNFYTSSDENVNDIQPVNEQWKPLQNSQNQRFSSDRQTSEKYMGPSRSREQSKEKEQSLFFSTPAERQHDECEQNAPTFKDNELYAYGSREKQVINKNDAIDDNRSIRVWGMVSSIGEEMLHLVFENEKRSGGGPIDKFEMDVLKEEAILTFEEEHVANRVLKKFDKDPCVILDKEVFLEKYVPKEICDDLSDTTSLDPVLMKVSNFSPATTQEHLHLFFENKRKSGGDDVKTIQLWASDGYCLIEFDDCTVLDRVLERQRDQPLMLDGKELCIEKYVKPPPSETGKVNKLLRVVGIPSGITEEAITFYFEDYKKYGGGHIESIDYDEEIGVAKIKYEDESVLNQVLERAKYRPIYWQNKLLTLDSVDEEKDISRSNFSEDDTLSVLSSMSGLSSATSCRENTALLKVGGLASSLSTDLIQCFFENTRRVGGGDIENIERNVERGTALIKFESVKVIDQILKKFKEKPLVIEGSILSIEKYYPEVQEHEVEKICDRKSDHTDRTMEEPMIRQPSYLKVTGFPSGVSKDTLEYFFENTRRSGGDEIKDIQWETLNEGYVLIQFEDESVVDRVVAKSQQEALKLDDKNLSVTKYVPPPPKPVDPLRLFLTNINSSTTKDCLLNFLEAKSNAAPTNIEYSEDKQSALVSYTEKPDFDMITNACSTKQLEGHHLKVEKVPISSVVKVSNIDSKTTKDTIEFYFENKKRSNGGPVEKVELYSDNGFALVFFEDSAVADQVCEPGRKHTIDGQKLNISLYYECLEAMETIKSHKSSEQVTSTKRLKLEIELFLLLYLKRVPQAKITFEKLLQDNMAKLENWPEENNTTLIIVYDDKTEPQKSITDWSSTMKAKLASFLGSLDIETVSTYPEIARSPEFKTELSKIKAENAAMFVKDNALNIAGQKESVKKVADQAQTMFRTLEEKLKNKIEQTVKEISLKKYQLSLLLSKNFTSHVKKLLPGVEVMTDFKKGKVIFSGLIEEIQKAETEMYKIINMYVSKTMQMSDQGKKLLFENEVRKVIKKKMDEKNIIGVWHANQLVENATVYSDTIQHVDAAIKIIKDIICEKHIQIPGDAKVYMQSKEWSAVQADLNKFKPKLCYRIAEEWDYIYIAVTDDLRDVVMRKIEAFLQNNSSSEKTISIGKGKFRFLKEHKTTELDELKQRLMKKSVFLHPSNNTDYKISGPKDGLSDAEQSLNKLVKDIKMLHLKFKKVGLRGFFDGMKGRDLIENVEKKERCVIEYGNTQDSIDVSAHNSTGLSEVVLSSGCKIIVSKSDMTKMAVDVIVNAANENLLHGAGLAGAIVSNGGKCIQEESDKIVQKHGRVPVGNVVVTHAGRLQCKRIFHAVGPHWRGGGHNEELALKSAVKKCMHKALADGHQSIAFPALCSGIFGYPVQKATKDIVLAIHDYFARLQGTVTLTVYLCDIQAKTVKCFSDALMSTFASATTSAGNQDLLGDEESDSDEDDDDDVDDDGDDDGDDEDTSAAGVSLGDSHRDASSNPKRINISVVQGSLTDMKVDALVNTVGGDLNLSSGAVSKALLKAAGNGIQQECMVNYPTGLPRGQLAQTTGGQLSCKYIFHGSLCNYGRKHDSSLQMMSDLVTSCLKNADDNGLSSIAFPALGTGNLGYPSNIAASQMFNSVRKYDAMTTSTNLKKVLFVVYPSDKSVVYAFKSEESKQSGTGHRQRGASKSRTPSRTRQSKAKGDCKKTESVVLCTYSDSMNCIHGARERINACLNEEFKEKTIKKDTIRHLRGDQIRRLRKTAASSNLKISIVKRKSLIRIAGRCKNVQEATEYINDMLQGIQLKYHETSSAKVLSKVAQWYYVEGGVENEYASEVNGLIEKSYQEKKPRHELKTKSGEVYIIDFKNEIEYKKTNPGDSVPVIRKDLTEGEIKLPKSWEPMKKGETIRFVTLASGSPEYKKIAQMFSQSSGGQTAAKIERIQNKSLYYQYIAKKGEIEQECSQGVVEQELWHGTAEQSVDSITHKGFNRSLANNGSIGIGTYFAVRASYSVQGYCSPGTQGRHIFLCNVLTGDSVQGYGGIKLPPAKSTATAYPIQAVGGRGASCHNSYHSVTDNPTAPNMFVIFHDAQGYPMYHIYF